MEEVNSMVIRSWNSEIDGFQHSKGNFKFKSCSISLMAWLRGREGKF